MDSPTMKAAQFSTYGGPEVIEINNNTPKPTPAKGQVLVEVFAATINPFDYKVRRGYMKDGMPLQFPQTIGGNFSGVVTEVGGGVSQFKIGDEVYGAAYAFAGGSGTMAEFVVAKEDAIAIKPKNVTHQEAASLVLVGVSALQAIEQHINLQKDPSSASSLSLRASAGKQKILINGGAGGIGSITIQLAKSKGAYVATTVSTRDIAFAKALGADEVIDYKTQTFEIILKDYDAVFDTVGQETADKSFQILKRNGILVTMSAPKIAQASEELAKESGVTVITQNTETNTKNLNRLTQLVESGVIKPQIDKVFSLDQAKEAFEYQETSHPRGKVVISIKE